MKLTLKELKFYLILVADAFVLLIMVWTAAKTLDYSDGIHCDFRPVNGHWVVTEIDSIIKSKVNFRVNDTLLYNLNCHQKITTSLFPIFAIFALYDSNGVAYSQPVAGDTVHLLVKRGQNVLPAEYVISSLNKGDVIAGWFAGAIWIFIGLFCFLKKRDDPAAVIFHFMAIMIGASNLAPLAMEFGTMFWGIIRVEVTTFCAIISAAAVLHFSLTFPRKKLGKYRWIVIIPYLLVLLDLFRRNDVSIIHGVGYSEKHPELFFIDIIDNWRDIILFALAFISFIHSYFQAKDQAERKKVLWVVGGFTFSLVFAILELSQLSFFGKHVLPIPLWFYTLMYAVAPICTAIAIIRYQLFNIDTIINRSVVYVGVIAFLALVYEGIVHVVALILHGTFTRDDSVVTSTIATAAVALLFEPAKEKTQHLIDKKFYRTKYNYRQASVAIGDGILHAVDLPEMSSFLMEQIDLLIPVERIGFYTVEQPGHRIITQAQYNCESLEGRDIHLDLQRLREGDHLPLGAEDMIEADAKVRILPAERFIQWGLAIVVPLFSERKDVLGFIVLGRKKSQMKFTLEDVDLLRSVATRAELTIERLEHQEQIRLRRQEEERRHELQKMKALTGTSLPHELDVLTDNLVLFRKIEHGELRMNFEQCNLNDIMNEAVKSLTIALAIDHFELDVIHTEASVTIRCDRSAIIQVIRTMISNAMKYSGTEKYIKFAAQDEKERVVISITDRGIGIREEEQEHIFKPFFRGTNKESVLSGGSGLGLAVVEHIMKAHGGTVEVESILEKGSTFTLIFPLVA